MKKISIIILFAIFFIGCSSNDYKQNSIPMSELNSIPDKVILNIEPQYQTTNYTCATVSLGMAIKYVTNDQIVLSEEDVWNTTGTTIKAARKYTSKSGYPEHTTRSKSELYSCTSGCWI